MTTRSAFRALIRSTPKCARVPNRSVLSVTGANASQFLNGILSTTVPNHGGFYSAFLHAQGRVLYDVFVYPQQASTSGEPGYLVEYDPRPSNPETPPLPALLKRYVLRSKVKIRDVGTEWEVWGAWGDEKSRMKDAQRKWMFARSGAIEPVWESSGLSPWATTSSTTLHDLRAVGMGWRELVRQGDKALASSEHDVVESDQYMLHRMMRGVPEGVEEIVPMSAFPLESNLDVMGGVDFRKGCYVGQELTVRTYHTGTIRKRILPVQIFDPNSPTPSNLEVTDAPSLPRGSDITAVPIQSSDSERIPRTRGTSKLIQSLNGVGLALMRLEHVEGVENGKFELQIKSDEGDLRWRVRHWWPEGWPEVVQE
ncbi:Aminomethyltransferase folate-binding domain-containing protein [Sistotremastrum niveocremeum HHB9708]|uniref:Aminomethyltransferase folate-binding domain-containing protein n=2 Tax=Sistotremastraceae TaxID=3402574 RepID=A0A164ZR24_9AGAM|nr:Aminomethyltransferase folate-binding domain-containing protein [Sistotremastrum niveocremeum HHB9708]KZT36818.1 Aminomethyltransferase folate-binding domain-containing protein [Sistotremastrum suecicum HHB10207 ss-3]